MAADSCADRICIGTDEAGYGPNLGPLVIVATAWELDSDLYSRDLRQQLSEVVTDDARQRHRRLLVADSKSVYSSGDSLEALEVSVLSFLKTLCASPNSVAELGQLLAPDLFTQEYTAEPWNDPADSPVLPADCLAEVIAEWCDLLNQEMQNSGCRIRGIIAEIVFPERLNRLLDLKGSKGAVLSDATLQLIKTLHDRHAADHYEIICDRHGGRSRYDELIAEQFEDQFVFRIEETRQVSRYRTGNVEFCFRTRAEEFLPVALASMTAKYLRELLMNQFNSWWLKQVPGLRPTRGYPVDAKRFREDVDEHRANIGIADHVFWRNR